MLNIVRTITLIIVASRGSNIICTSYPILDVFRSERNANEFGGIQLPVSFAAELLTLKEKYSEAQDLICDSNGSIKYIILSFRWVICEHKISGLFICIDGFSLSLERKVKK